MDLLDQQDFSNDQKWILHLRCIEKMSYSQIRVSWDIAFQDDENKQSISPAAIKTCFRRSALALKWEKGTIYGNTSYLSNPDIEKLKEYISEECLNEHLSDPSDVLAEAHLIRLERQIKAIHFLRTIKCNNIAEELESEEESDDDDEGEEFK